MRPQLKRDPLGSYDLRPPPVLAIRLAFALLFLVIAYYTILSGFRDGIVSRKIRPRLSSHDLTGIPAVVFGSLRILAGAMCIAVALVLVVWSLRQ